MAFPLSGLQCCRIYLWQHLETFLYAARVDKEEALHHRTVGACQTIRNYPNIFDGCGGPWWGVEECIDSHGGYFEHLCEMSSLSCILRITCFRIHVDVNIFSCFYETRAHSFSVPFNEAMYKPLLLEIGERSAFFLFLQKAHKMDTLMSISLDLHRGRPSDVDVISY
jgi:hypothetical protein